MTAVPRVRLLLVDDNEEFLRAESAWIGAQPGYEIVATARSGEAALELADRLRPDVVLMDLAMPGIGGFEAIRELKQRVAPPAVVAVSLHDSQAVRAEASTAGADGFVPKARLSTLMLPVLRDVQGLARRRAEGAALGEHPGEGREQRQRPQFGRQEDGSTTPGVGRSSPGREPPAWGQALAALAGWFSSRKWRRREGFVASIETTPR
ncbi:MAG: response regulator transcription factor [Acidobacteria bacterium]|jgi:CheY-like chemotaxis protein|nr:response regulator transcription factor [Acidobacteriota bacterium]